MKHESSKTKQQSFKTNYKRAITPMIILKLLSEAPMYPYQIQQEAQLRSGGEYIMPLLYKPMMRLQEQGYIAEDHKEISEDNRVRIYYSITAAGLEYLNEVKEEFYLMFDLINKLLVSTD